MVLNEFQHALWSLVKPYYITPHRFYHTMTHVDAMLHGYDKFFGKISLEDYLAILYHDAVYKPWSNTNEEDSVQLMRLHQQNFFTKVTNDKLYLAEKRILATKHGSGQVFGDCRKIVDLDLMILGREDQVYDEYAENTRKEYVMYSDEEWRVGRTKVLQGFLKKRIFLTDELHSVFEEQARKNITREIESLQECQSMYLEAA